ncbi:MAG: LysR substrate-binding domain-containing protein [Paracoccaceae bacterium]
MATKRNVLPPLDYLLAFESAAKYQSFATASHELNISESAISRKIRLLELHYGIPLFVRGHQSISLTHQGRQLIDAITPELQSIRDTSTQILSLKNRNEVTVAATNSAASLWLMPRLRKFRSRNKQIKIMLVASDNDVECLGDNIDLSILRGSGNWPGYRSRMLFGETIFPVCSPNFLKNNGGARNLEELPGMSLIEVSSRHTEWMDWTTWLNHQGQDSPIVGQTVTFNTYPLAVQAAVDGLGIVLGWGHLVDHLLASAALVRPQSKKFERTDFGYYLLKSEKSKSFPERNVVEEWLLKESAARKSYAPPT